MSKTVNIIKENKNIFLSKKDSWCLSLKLLKWKLKVKTMFGGPNSNDGPSKIPITWYLIKH